VKKRGSIPRIEDGAEGLILTDQNMEPHCCCHVRAAFYLLPDADIIFFFLSTAAALCHARSEDDMSLVKDFAKRSEKSTTYCVKASVGIHLLHRCCSSARPMRRLCACTANRGAQRRGYEHFYVPNSITRVSAKYFSAPLLMTTSGCVASELLPTPYLVSFTLTLTNFQHPAMNSRKFM